MTACTYRACAWRNGLCPVSLLCGCACHGPSAVSTAPSGQPAGAASVVDPDVELYRYRNRFGHVVTSTSPQPEGAAEDAPDAAEDEEHPLDPRQMAEVLIAGALAGQGHTRTPHGDAVLLMNLLERNGLRIVAA